MGARLVEQSQVILTGSEAVAKVERAIACEAVSRDPSVAEGLAMAGVRSSSLVGGPSLGTADGVAVAETSCVHHVHAAPGHERGGAFELAATSAQQATDHCLAAHLLSRKLGRAGLCSLSLTLAKDLNVVSLPEPELIADLLNDDTGAPEPDASSDRIVELAREALQTVGTRTARPAGLVEFEGNKGAEVILVACGADTAPAREAARILSDAGVAVGTLSVILVRPFPEADVQEALSAARRVFVVHTPGQPSALLAPICRVVEEKTDVRALPAPSTAQLLETLVASLPSSGSKRPKPVAEPEEIPSRRLVVAPGGPWGEQMARRVLTALGHLTPLQVGRRSESELGATLLRWDSAKLPNQEMDLLLASHPAALEPDGALSLVRAGSAVVVLAEANSAQELLRLLTPGARESLRERQLRLHWIAPPNISGEESFAEMDRAASWALTGAALAAVQRPKDAAAMATKVAVGEQATRWLGEGATTVHALDRASLEAAVSEELNFRSTPDLPRLPEPVDDVDERQRHARWIRRFHHLGARTFDPSPRLPVRPAVFDSLAESLRSDSSDPFVLLARDDAGQPIVARGLRELLREGIKEMEAADRHPQALAANLGALVAFTKQLLTERGAGAPLEGLLSEAGEKLTGKLALSAEEDASLRSDILALREILPRGGQVLGLEAGTPLRLYVAVLDAIRAPLRRRFTAQLKQLRERLRDLLDLDRMGSADGRTPEALTAQLGATAAARIDPGAFSRTLPGGPSPAQLGEARRRRVEEALATIERHLDQQARLPKVVFLHPPGVDFQLAGEEHEEHPDPLAAAVGYFDGTARRLARLFRAARMARLEAEGRYRPDLHDEFLGDLDWEAFTHEELALVPLVAVLTTGTILRQRGQGSLSALLRSSRPVHVIVQDEVGAPDEAEDLSAFHVDLGYLVMAHREAFAVGSTLAHPERLTEGLARMVRAARPGVALLHLPNPAMGRWHALLAEAALRGRACPQFLYDPDAGASWADRFALEGNPQPECAWPIQQIRYLEDGSEKTLEVAFTFADAVALEPAYLRHLRVMPRSAWDDEIQRPLAEYLQIVDLEGRQPLIPYLWVVDESGILQRAVVTRELAMACRDRLRGWRILQELAGYENAYAERAAATAREQALAEAARELSELEKTHANALANARGEGARESMERLAAVLINPAAFSSAAPVSVVAATAAPIAVAPAAEAVAEPVPEPAPEEEEALSFDEPYIDAVLCTTCNECTNINSRVFQYNANKQAFIADASAGTFAQLVKAAELCPARCIHPGKPRSGDSTATPELIKRAAAFN